MKTTEQKLEFVATNAVFTDATGYTEETTMQSDLADLKPELNEVQETPEDSSVLTFPVQEFLEEIKANPNKYSDREVIDKLFVLTKIAYDQCWYAKLPQTAEAIFNGVNLGFSLLIRVLLVRHNAQIVQQPPQQNLTQKSNLIVTG